MIELEFKTDNEAYEYCMLIIKDMITSFNITEEEAVDRMNSDWGHIEKIDKDDIMFHEEPDYWSRKIYYNSDCYWWLPNEILKAKKYNPATKKYEDS